jgi:hypothetical protein
MKRKRRATRALEVSKRCACPDRQTSDHHWYLSVGIKGKRQRIENTALFPGEPVEITAAKARHLAQQHRPIKPVSARPTVRDVSQRYGRNSYYLDGLRRLLGDDKPIDDVTTADIKRCVEVWKERPKCGPVAIRHLLQTARHLFNWAIREGYRTHTPFKSPQGATRIGVKKSKARTRRVEPGEASGSSRRPVPISLTSSRRCWRRAVAPES